MSLLRKVFFIKNLLEQAFIINTLQREKSGFWGFRSGLKNYFCDNKLEIQELSMQELEEVNGGIAPWLIIAAGALVFLAIDYLQDGHVDGKINI